MSKGTLAIHTQNILPIIKKWLYSDKDIFLRELVSNACDAITKRRVLHERAQASWQEPRIDIEISRSEKLLSITDSGLGMDQDELVRYLSQIAFSSAEEFLSHYQDPQASIIGHFGLGFYSAFMVAGRVQVESKSYKTEAPSCRWSCEGGLEYEVEPFERESVGTTLRLFIDAANEEYLDEQHLESILLRYCRFVPYAIYLNGKRVATSEPLWLKAPKDCSNEEYLDFYKRLYPNKQEPLFWVHLDVDYPFHLKGILYFPRMSQEREATQDAIELYYNRIFVSSGCRDILPEYLLPLHGCLDSSDLPLNVSRSALQLDRSVKQLGAYIAKKVADSLKEIYKNDQQRYELAWRDMEIIVKWGALHDEKFYERVQDLLLWQNDSESWTNLKSYLEKAASSHPNKVYYTQAQGVGSPLVNLYKQKQIEVIRAQEIIDLPLFAFLERKTPNLKFQRIDAAVDELLTDPGREKTLLDAAGQTEGTRLEKLFSSFLGEDKLTVQAKSLADDSLPVMLVVDEEQRRFSDYLNRQTGQFMGYPNQKLIINSNNPLITGLERLQERDSELAKQIGQELVELARFAHRLLDSNSQHKLVERSWALLQKMVQKLL